MNTQTALVISALVISGLRGSKSVETLGERFRAPKGSMLQTPEVLVVGYTKRMGRIVVTDGTLTETWHRCNDLKSFPVEA